tara:strand:+ start:2205 stop:3398 length:1194 start_codon:yes stop_codon:yes gene_type:complete
MPELKNTFTGGKMEKDRDERIVGSGLYREALNIEVSTSEDSEVGAAQNILGNIQVTSAIAGPPKDYSACTFSFGQKGRYDGTNSHIAHVVDPQNDKLYRFVATDGGSHGVWMDRVVEYNTNSKIEDPWQLKERAVMVDIYKVATKINSVEAGPPTPPTPLFYGCYNGVCTDCSSNPTACNAPGQVIYSEAACGGGCPAAVIPGCMDPLYVDFNPLANIDDGSCLTLIPAGCTDPLYTEYDPLATIDDGSCLTLIPVVSGCDGGLAKIEQWKIYGYIHNWCTASSFVTAALAYSTQPTYASTPNNPWSSVVGRDIIELYSITDIEIWFNAVGLHINNNPGNYATVGGPLVQWDPTLIVPNNGTLLAENIKRFNDEAGLDERFLEPNYGGITMICPEDI